MNDWTTLLLLAVGLAMDAFAVSICKGLSAKRGEAKHFFFVAGIFGLLQGIMPFLGYFLGSLVLRFVENYLGIISFVILLIIGLKMIAEGIKSLRQGSKPANRASENADSTNCGETEKNPVSAFLFLPILFQGIATSIDALAAGVSLLNFSLGIYISASVISVLTFFICLFGLFLGFKFGSVLKAKNGAADIIGGVILLFIGAGFLF